MPRGRKKQRQCWMCEKKFRGRHHMVLEKDIAAMRQLAKKYNAQDRKKTKRLICDECWSEHFGKSLYVKKVKKQTRNNRGQREASREANAQNKERNRLIADAKDERENTTQD